VKRSQQAISKSRANRRGRKSVGIDGSVAVELGLTAPILVILTVGIVDLGNWFNFNQALNAATRIGAEYARGGVSCQPTGGWGGATAVPANCTTDVQRAVTRSMAFVPALNAPTVSLDVYCRSPGTPDTYVQTMPGNSCYTNPPAAGSTGPNRVFVTVGATQPFSPMISWPFMPKRLAAVAQVRVQ
jgi:Flp pilus assembly protein TadG